ncbi:hypothetical protein FNL56_18375 [Tardiphaga sp. vice304]|uniref:hypothetical protein n=1 Tax=Tardiphaga sp. vice304 TaxID=2592817 RepID=UPI0011654E0D|nr:hypothetical protein [Tardiphaga sp. vice304]QDM27875.1 hypothetical protein FNL56_18375 [Tardiphaga sp. vice304]
MHPQVLRELSQSKVNPEFASAIREIESTVAYAAKMHKAGKLSKAEMADLEGHLWGQYISALPVDDFHEMMNDGRLDQLMALASHEDSRNGSDVEQERAAVLHKVKADALDEAWLSQKIDAQTYAELSREHVGRLEVSDDKSADGDYDAAASEVFASRHDRDPSQENILEKWLSKNSDGPNKASEKLTWNYDQSDEIERDQHGRDKDGYIDHDAIPNEEA